MAVARSAGGLCAAGAGAGGGTAAAQNFHLVKSGSGTLRLTGTSNNYTGQTLINNGELQKSKTCVKTFSLLSETGTGGNAAFVDFEILKNYPPLSFNSLRASVTFSFEN